MEREYKELISKIKGYNPNPNLELILKAWEFAKLAHYGQMRLSGDPTIAHPLAVAQLLADWKLDSVSIAAGLLHDTIEDCAIKKEELTKEFGGNVSDLVDGVTNIGKLKLRGSKEEEFVENLRKMFLAMAKDLRVVLVKIADRLHNMQTLSYLPEDKQKRIAKETLEVYAPLAERLGMGESRAELDDLSFPYVHPEDYKKVKKDSAVNYKKVEDHIKKMKKVLLKALVKEGIKAKIDGRKKHLYSLWKKLTRPEIEWDFDKIHDIVALRILVNTISECYSALGTVHSFYKPVPHLGISDFIAQPKPNGYRSIHTRVFGPEGKIVEIQIRTYEMHEESEFGVAAHWAYSEVKTAGKLSDEVLEKKGVVASEKKLSWVKQLADWQKELTDSKEFLRAVKFDALSKRIFVFSPNSDVYELPNNATPVDYAYAVHTDLGNFIKGARVDGRVVPLNYKLKSGQVVEVIKSKNPKPPNSDWLEFVVTTQARREINKYLRSELVKR